MKMDEPQDDLQTEYSRNDLGDGVRGKYYQDYQSSTVFVQLTPEVAKAFPSEEAVNAALMSLIRIAKASST